MADDALRAALPGGWIVRVQNPLALDDESAPEPDIAVVRGARIDFRHAHPARPALIIEVAESSLGFDRVAKGSLYARAVSQSRELLAVQAHLARDARDGRVRVHETRVAEASRPAHRGVAVGRAMPSLR